MKHMNAIDWVAIVLVVVGGLNWGLMGFFQYDLIATIFGDTTIITRIVYGLIGLSTLYAIYGMSKCCKAHKTCKVCKVCEACEACESCKTCRIGGHVKKHEE